MIIDHEFKWSFLFCVPKQKDIWDPITLCQIHFVNFVFYFDLIVTVLLLQVTLL